MKWGIWNGIEKRFVFCICENTREKAEDAFWKRVGKLAYLWRYEAKIIPENFKNPNNSAYKKKKLVKRYE